MIEINDLEFMLLRQYVEHLCGIEVPVQKRYLFTTNLRNFLEAEHCGSFSELYNRLATAHDRLLERRLVQAMTNHESSFFRDMHPYTTFRHQLLPALACRRQREAVNGSPPRLRFLSCGCSAGQEPYSIAICVSDWLENQKTYAGHQIGIVGSDVSAAILARAAAASFSAADLGPYLPKAYRDRYFKSQGDRWLLNQDIRSMVLFAELNLAGDFSYVGRFDAIFCRNVIIYFSIAAKRRILETFRSMLRPGGFLILGASESVYKLTDAFRPVHEGPTTYYVPVGEEDPSHPPAT